MPPYPPIPVPQKLREFLADYPECIAEIEQRLARYSAKPSKLQPFDGALWALEGVTERMMLEARELSEQASERGDAALAEAAKAKERRLMDAASLRFRLIEGVFEHIRDVWGLTP